MKKSSKIISCIVAGLMALSMTACSSSSETQSSDASKGESKSASSATASTSESDGEVYKIGVLQLTQHAALDAANEGFFEALDDAGIQYEADQQNAAGEQSACQTIAEKFVSDGDDLIFAIATPAAQAVAGVTTDIPVIITAVTDPADSGLVESNDAPGGNVTGTSDLTPVKEQIDLLKKVLPDAKTVGILYCSAESNSVLQAEMAKEACTAAGLAYEEYTVSSSNEIQSVVESMVGKVDAIYSPTDNMIAAGMATVAMIANDNQIPTIVGEEGMVEAGGLVTYGINYHALGYLAGQQAAEILQGKADPATTPIGYLSADDCTLSVNEETAAALGIDPSVLKE